MSDESPTTTVHNAFVPLIKGTSVEMHNAGALAVVAQGDLSVQQGGAQFLLAGGDLSVREGGAQTMLARGDVSISEGGALLAAGATVEINHGWVGVALGANVDVKGARVLLAPIQALCFGAGFGVAVTLIRRLIGR